MITKLSEKHGDRLARLAHHLLTHTTGSATIHTDTGRNLDFDMEYYANNGSDLLLVPDTVHACGTSCCLAGYAPFVFPETRNIGDWVDVVTWLSGDQCSHARTRSFLFSASWQNDVHHAAARVLYVLRGYSEKALSNDGWSVYRLPVSHDAQPSAGLDELVAMPRQALLDELETHFTHEITD